MRAQALLFPSTFDTSGLVGIEAAIHKTPTVFVEGSNAADGVTDNQNGFLCKENKESFGQKLIELLDKGQEYMGEIGEVACKELSRTWQDVANEVIEKYQKIVDDHREKLVNESVGKNKVVNKKGKAIKN